MENEQTVNIEGTDYNIADLSPETVSMLNRYVAIQSAVAELSVKLREQSALIEMYAQAISASVAPEEQD